MTSYMVDDGHLDILTDSANEIDKLDLKIEKLVDLNESKSTISSNQSDCNLNSTEIGDNALYNDLRLSIRK